MNYIIFGGAGFIGTHLIHMLRGECVNAGDKIVVKILNLDEKELWT